MSALSDLIQGDAGLPADLVSRLDAWAGEVLVLRADTLARSEDVSSEFRRLDDLFASYKARDRLGRVAGADDLLVVRAIDELLKSFTEELGRGWLELTGMEESAGTGWWWKRLPIAGPARDDSIRAYDEHGDSSASLATSNGLAVPIGRSTALTKFGVERETRLRQLTDLVAPSSRLRNDRQACVGDGRRTWEIYVGYSSNLF